MASISLFPSSLYPLIEAKDRPTAIASWERQCKFLFQGICISPLDTRQTAYYVNYRKCDDCTDDGNLGTLCSMRSIQMYLLDRAWVHPCMHLLYDLHAVLVSSCSVDRSSGQNHRDQRRNRRQPEQLLVPPPLWLCCIVLISKLPPNSSGSQKRIVTELKNPLTMNRVARMNMRKEHPMKKLPGCHCIRITQTTGAT